ncbi:DUF5034 domain-containing protein [Niabella hibiscisoli]|uniref:DUF5034 domain-containing protein n=1 Tax=Niabella hibiscisoli TaxID=1825928 RepID=UPI001F113278|nr:DUF5034 domain-containing protein [Niabella hibiscisoli]MCH5720741.1 DUF5034 domain-containing protein [Niabella hibiscisoli]
MITLRAAILVVLCFIVVVGTRCSCCKCDEIDVKYTSTFEKMELVSLDNSGKDTVQAISGTVNRNAYAIKMNLFSSIGAQMVHQPCRNLDLFISSANAMGCRCPGSGKYIPTDSILSISIIDLEHFDTAMPAGSDVTSRFRFYKNYGGTYIKIEELLNSSEHNLFYPNVYYSSAFDPMTLLQTSAVFMLMQPPATSGIHRFKCTVLLKSGLQIEQTTSIITLQ